ncbi:peptidoglycan editing factor PgeF [Paenibacillus sp. JNUCC31]|uniref:peptidoglycan editing factor PgeF n=1 Tax=Paenibacillus sp. JNUCC-31 TaxID=2777983 RepID=UPI00177F8C19|nr:peptidoglycan editing factor PgeF [Paenibacillus sp. JNUCC-31]QOS80227.1 peptidoglycan editing factor PgeF [Paenibacillus sp. JNUCC-31]
MEPFMLDQEISERSGNQNSNMGPDPLLLYVEPWKQRFEHMKAGFTTRQGGVGSTPYASLNCAYHVGDDPEDVLKNRKLVAEKLGFSLESWTCGEQVHGKHVAVITTEDRGRGLLDRQSALQDTDGLVTNVPGVLLTSFYADCVPLYFYDPVRQAVGLAHAGWKGTVAGIAESMVETLEREYGSRRQDIHAAIGPSIGDCCYEVDEAVMKHVRVWLDQSPGNDEYRNSASNQVYQSAGNGKTMLNLKECNRHIMMKAGILPDHIECTTWCTSCNPELFFSYRKENGITGRMASWIGLEER